MKLLFGLQLSDQLVASVLRLRANNERKFLEPRLSDTCFCISSSWTVDFRLQESDQRQSLIDVF